MLFFVLLLLVLLLPPPWLLREMQVLPCPGLSFQACLLLQLPM
jgi:hypothetical protein